MNDESLLLLFYFSLDIGIFCFFGIRQLLVNLKARFNSEAHQIALLVPRRSGNFLGRQHFPEFRHQHSLQSCLVCRHNLFKERCLVVSGTQQGHAQVGANGVQIILGECLVGRRAVALQQRRFGR